MRRSTSANQAARVTASAWCFWIRRWADHPVVAPGLQPLGRRQHHGTEGVER
jgi:hypothetical protein